MNGEVLHGGRYGPYHYFGDGVVIENGVFQAPVYFGKGAVLVNPTFLWSKWLPWSRTGDGATIDGGYWDAVDFGENTTLKSGVGASFTVGAGSTIDAPPKISGRGGEWHSGGHIVTGGDYLEMAKTCVCQNEWDSEVKRKGYLIVGDDGTAVVSVPRLLIVCE